MTPQLSKPAWLSFDSADDYARAREVLLSAGYTIPGIQKRLGLEGSVVLPNSQALIARKTSSGDSLDILLRLFLAGTSVDVHDAERALRPMSLDAWVRAGLIDIAGDSVNGCIKLLPSGDWVVAFDRHKRGHAHSQDMVLGVSNATLTLLNLTARRPVRRTLDLGTGCGIQGFFASMHSDQVFAVDSNPRAIRFADFNTRLNGIKNVECLEGDRFEPVRGKDFDFVICNAPFVISPASGYVSLDGGMQGDHFCRSIARDVPRYLTEGGMCQMLCNWAHFSGQNWEQQLATWFAETGCEVWVIRSRKDDAATYARLWIDEIFGEESEEFDTRFHEWMDYYEREGIEAMSMGLINIRRVGNRPTQIRIDDMPAMVEASGADILRLIELRSFVHSVPEEGSFLETRLIASPELRLENQYQSIGSHWQLSASRLFMARGLAYSVTTDSLLAEFVMRCDGNRTVREALQDASQPLNVDLSGVMSECLRVIRRCVELGFLMPSDRKEP